MKNEIPTFSEILQNPIIEAYEDDDFYYIRPKPQFRYDLTTYKVDKRTNVVSLLLYTKFISIEPSTRKINPDFLKKNDYLAHHGRLGQKWGVQNGPPYPLYRQEEFKKSGSYEKKMSRSSGLGNKTKANKKRDGARSGGTKFDLVKDNLKLLQEELQAKQYNRTEVAKARRTVDRTINSLDNPKKNGFRSLSKPETVDEAIENTNPWKNTPAGMMNCVNCATAACLRMRGYDVVASPNAIGRYGKDVAACIKNKEECAFTVDSLQIGHSEQSASRLIKSKFGGVDSYGAIEIEFPGGIGHFFNWEMKKGKVRFFDTQRGETNVDYNEYFRYTITNSSAEWLIRLDNADFNYSMLRKRRIVE